MAAVLNRVTKEYRRRANTPDFDTDPDYIIAPNLTGLVDAEGYPTVLTRYWKITGDVVSEMTQGEKDVVDAAAAAASKAATRLTIQLRSPDGNVWDVGVDDTGNLTPVKQP